MNAAPSQLAAVPTETAEPENRHEPSAVPSLSGFARRRMDDLSGEPLFLADWLDVTMLHFDVDPERLQRLTPLTIDCFEGRAFVSLVAFRMTAMRLARWPRLTRKLFRPFTESRFLNLRTYVRAGGEPGIQFLVEWLSNRASVGLGPVVYGLPYRAGRLDYTTRGQTVTLRARARNQSGGLDAELAATPEGEACERGSVDEFLMERYTAFTVHGRKRRRFHIWHRPWPQSRCRATTMKTPILGATFPELAEAQFVGANHSAGVRDVWMSRPYPL